LFSGFDDITADWWCLLIIKFKLHCSQLTSVMDLMDNKSCNKLYMSGCCGFVVGFRFLKCASHNYLWICHGHTVRKVSWSWAEKVGKGRKLQFSDKQLHVFGVKNFHAAVNKCVQKLSWCRLLHIALYHTWTMWLS